MSLFDNLSGSNVLIRGGKQAAGDNTSKNAGVSSSGINTKPSLLGGVAQSIFDKLVPTNGSGIKGVAKGLISAGLGSLQSGVLTNFNSLNGNNVLATIVTKKLLPLFRSNSKDYSSDSKKPAEKSAGGSNRTPLLGGLSPKEAFLSRSSEWMASKRHFTVSVRNASGKATDLNAYVISLEYTKTAAPANPVQFSGGFYDVPSSSEQTTISAVFMDNTEEIVRRWFDAHGPANGDGTFKLQSEFVLELRVRHGYSYDQFPVIDPAKNSRSNAPWDDTFMVRIVSIGIGFSRQDTGLLELPITFVTVDSSNSLKIIK